MKNTIVYITDPNIAGGGFADRITGMALLYRISKSFNCDFRIHFKQPFDFFDAFPSKSSIYKFDDIILKNPNSKLKIFNLIDENFTTNIDQLCKSLISEDGITALVFINNIKSFIFDPVYNNFIEIKHNQNDIDEIERNVLFEFGQQFLETNLKIFNSNVIRTINKLNSKTIGVQIRLGGNNSNWVDPNFKVPDFHSIISKLKELQSNFNQVYISSDNIDYKNNLIKIISEKWPTIFLNETPLHLERSSSEHSNFLSRSLGDHYLLRKCTVGIITSGGGYGRTAAIIEGAPYFRV